jgi:hypothetical protein
MPLKCTQANHLQKEVLVEEAALSMELELF